MTDDEKRAYSKGYAAGRKYVARTETRAARTRRQNRMWIQVFCAALNGAMINARWETGDKRWNNAESYARGVGRIADEVMEQHGWRAP